MIQYTAEAIREWQMESEFAHRYRNNRESDASSGLGRLMVMGLLHGRMVELGRLPDLDRTLVDWLGTHEGANPADPGFQDRAIKLIHDWSAEVYCHALLIKAASDAGLPASLSYSPADDARGVDVSIYLFGQTHSIQIRRAMGQPGNPDDVRKQLRRRMRGDEEPDGVIEWRPAFGNLDRRCQPYVPQLSDAALLFEGLAALAVAA